MRKLAFVVAIVALASPVHADCPNASPADALSKKAAEYENARDWSKAIETLEAASKIDPHDARLYFRLGRAHESTSVPALTEAKLAFEKAIALDPNWAEAHFALAEVQYRLSDEHDTLVHYTEAVRLRPDKGAYWVALADMYRRLGHFDEARKVSTEGVRFVKPDDPHRGELLEIDGRLLERAGDVDGALARFEAAKSACGVCDGVRSIVFFDLGRAYAKAKPPRASESAAALRTFTKRSCRGAAASRFVDECTESAAWLQVLPRP